MQREVEYGAALPRATQLRVLPPQQPDHQATSPPPSLSVVSLCPEIDCLRGRLPVEIIAAAERRALRLDIGADRVLIAHGWITEEAYLRVFAQSIGASYQPLERVPRSACPCSDGQLLDAVATGLLLIEHEGRNVFVVAPRNHTARNLAQGRYADLIPRLQLTTNEALNAFIAAKAGSTIARCAVEGLREGAPLASAGTSCPYARIGSYGLAAGWVAAASLAPSATLAATLAAASILFAAWIALRASPLFTRLPQPGAGAPIDIQRLPTYTLLIALYDEAAAVPGLVAALKDLNYPREKLDIKFILEPDDAVTRAAIDALELDPTFSIVTAPDRGPRTKPKALNAALPLARGTLLGVFDAEDRPERDQLLRAVEAFRAGGDRLACVQAHLAIDNTDDTWLTRLFTAEYAGLFDVFLPALAARSLPLPLGGTSNHFRTAILRSVRGWDPFNVTEDADLGTRLARCGYRIAMIPASTDEEAPPTLRPWLRQRTRWFKGWLQTYRVHNRRPLRLWRELGAAGALAFHLTVFGTVFAALIHPLMLMLTAFHIADAVLAPNAWNVAVATFAGCMTALGYATSAALGWVGLTRRNLYATRRALVLLPLLWLLLSVAAWRAVYELLFDPHRWNKTPHGLARSSRRRHVSSGVGQM